ncbi:methyltransferase [Kutzneria albida]|uniref:O-methyltransferase C-terminal domain-containing protein n=1 Tax=Kutzneria albida DSM 43870 TaxID=1449976 RepID=W5WEU2_9PSEU|nr:methyltransferase dimerization domain-containing protein [Kutzneria albida]AHH99367.1 hypothetical protein KALB_6007 [Kutzneria albida DSM 43870]
MSGPDPSRIVQIAVGYMAAKQLFAASGAGLFAALADKPLAVPELAESTGLPVSTTRILGDSMSSLGLLSRVDGRYALSPDAAAHLAGEASGVDLRPFLAFLDQISYPHWQQFERTVRTGGPGELDLEGQRWSTFLSGVMTYNALHAEVLAAQFDFGPYREVLDLGGLSSAFAVRAMRANDSLRTTFVIDPNSVEPVRQAVAEAGLADRSVVLGEATPTARPLGSFDLVLVNHVVHRFTAEQNSAILANARAAAAPGARLLLLDFFLDEDEQPRALDALHAGEYLVIDGTVVYPEREVRSWLDETGWRTVDRLTLPGCPRVLIAEAV